MNKQRKELASIKRELSELTNKLASSSTLTEVELDLFNKLKLQEIAIENELEDSTEPNHCLFDY